LRWRQDWKGGTDVNEIFIHVPDLADASEVRGWARSYQRIRQTRGSSLDKISGYHLRAYNESGTKLGDFDLGSEDDGYVEDHIYHSPNGYSY
jgi:hypothetical protein